MHWTVWQEDKPFVPNLDKFGFVYLITNNQTRKKYVGCKQYFSMGKKKKKHKWETYMSSSKYLKADIEKIGKKHFTFEVIAEYKNKRSLRYYEMYYQVKWDVLTATMKDSDDPAYYNSYVGGKFFPPIESFQDPEFKRKISELHKGKIVTEETRIKMSESHLTSELVLRGKKHRDYKGKVEFYLDGKRMVVDCLCAWGKENGYDGGSLGQMARTTRDGFFKDSSQKSGKAKRFKIKGPLGTITKVKRLEDGKQ